MIEVSFFICGFLFSLLQGVASQQKLGGNGVPDHKTGQNIMKENWTLTKKEKAIREINADAV